MANAVQSALGEGLAMLASAAGNGDTYRVAGASTTWFASLTSEIKPDGIGGRILITKLLVLRSAFSTLPAEGVVIEGVTVAGAVVTATGDKWAVVGYEPAAGGFINIIVRSEIR